MPTFFGRDVQLLWGWARTKRELPELQSFSPFQMFYFDHVEASDSSLCAVWTMDMTRTRLVVLFQFQGVSKIMMHMVKR